VTQSAPENAVLSAWEQTLGRRGDAPAVLAPDGQPLRTFRGIELEARELAERFNTLTAGSVVAVQIGNSARWPAVVLALFSCGLIPLPLGRHVESGELELALATCQVAALIRCDGEQLQIEPCEAVPIRWPGARPDLLKLTSGTTSAPRAVRFSAAQLLADCENICRTMGIGEGDLNFGVIPFSHSYGFSNLVTPLLCRGVPLVASEDRLPRAILHDLERSGATVFPGMPVFFQKLAELENTPELPALRLCISAGALLAPDVARRFTAKFGRKIHAFYGASECGGMAYDASDSIEYEEGFLGTPMRGVEIEHSAAGEAGLIRVRSAAVGEGYFPEDEPEVLSGGTFTPGDLLHGFERGLYLTGRASELINIAGRKLNPMELEQRLTECAGVKQAIVFGVPSALRGEEPIACIVAEQGTDAGAVLRYCQASLSQWQRPKDIWIVPEIPVNERGKISRRALAAEYLSAARS
jgi:long-chain acyl-CoA synthetase